MGGVHAGRVAPPSSPLVTVPGLDGGHVAAAIAMACDSAWLRYRQPARSDGTSPLGSMTSQGSQNSDGEEIAEGATSKERKARG